MFTEDEKKVLLNLLNQVLPPQVENMLFARNKLAAGQVDFTQEELSALHLLLDKAQYSGNEQQIKALLEQTAVLRNKLFMQPDNSVQAKDNPPRRGH